MSTNRFMMLAFFMLHVSLALTAEADMPLPAGVSAVWDIEKSFREKTEARERVCLNGLWRWQPARNEKGTATPDNPVMADIPAPDGKWGFFKVPGCWPGIGDYMQKDSQTLYFNPAWKDEKIGEVSAAWHQREFSVPADWAGRRIVLSTEYLNSLAVVYIDGKKAGKMQFPGGELDITALCKPGGKHLLTMLVIAAPLSDVTLLFSDTNTKPQDAKKSRARVDRRGLCGDVYLESTPVGARIGDVRIETSVRKGEIALDTALLDLNAETLYALQARIVENGKAVKEFTGDPFKAGDLKEGRITVVQKWKPEDNKLWDIHTPGNMFQLELSLIVPAGKTLDAALPVRFGFREFWIDGRDFYLNGTRLFLSCIPIDNATIGSALSTYAAAKESMLRMKSFGINFVYTHNFGCDPGEHLSFAEILRAADDVGMLVALTQPHFGQYDWKAANADSANGYARHAEFYVKVAGSHPAVVVYAMSHNATGYNEDMNPDLIDGSYQRRQEWAVAGANKALRAEAIVRKLDPGRIVYHHSSGNLSSMHTINFYPNFTPIQELSDWFEHWATKGVKPLFTCEYAAPFSWDWTMYRGWYWNEKHVWTRNFGSAKAPWEFCLAEWNAQFVGDRAFKISEMEKKNLRWEGQQLKAGNTWFRWDYPYEVGSTKFEERHPVVAAYYTANFRAFRTWGVSAISPWEHSVFWKLRDGTDRGRKNLEVDWEHLQRPGFSPDYVEGRFDSFVSAYERADWIATPVAQALMRNNMPLLAYIAGKPAQFTSNDHNFIPGEAVEKQLIIINNSRETISCECEWSLTLPQALAGSAKISVKTGDQARVPLRFDLPAGLAAGNYAINAAVRFSNGELQKDTFAINVLLPPKAVAVDDKKIALFDPAGETAKWLAAAGVKCQSVAADADLSAFETLIVGKGALTESGAAPDIVRVRDGLKVILFEQTPAVLEKRFGFRVVEYGLRNVFKRVPDHPLLSGLQTENLSDWRGEATILPAQLKVQYDDRRFNGAPMVKWGDIDVTRIWRCGCRGNVASVLIEKPACGDFLPIVDGGFSLQYSPLMLYREGKGFVLFCQLDVTGRTEADPAADLLARNILQYAAVWKAADVRTALYAGNAEGKAHFEKSGLTLGAFDAGKLSAGQVLIAGPGSGAQLAEHGAAITEFLKAGGHVLALGLGETEANSFLPVKVITKKTEHISAYFEPPPNGSLLAGVCAADVHNRDPREIPLLTGMGSGVLGVGENGGIVYCQLVPWEFKYKAPQNSKRTFRRVSFMANRLLGNLGVQGSTHVLHNFHSPLEEKSTETRWLDGLYLDLPEEWDDPYRFFRW